MTQKPTFLRNIDIRLLIKRFKEINNGFKTSYSY